jgi:hypothetical protein
MAQATPYQHTIDTLLKSAQAQIEGHLASIRHLQQSIEQETLVLTQRLHQSRRQLQQL